MLVWLSIKISERTGRKGETYLKIKRWHQDSKENLFFGSLILIYNESTIQLVMSALIFINTEEGIYD